MYLQGKTGVYGKAFEWAARRMFEKTKIASNLERARTLRGIIDKHHFEKKDKQFSPGEVFQLHQVLVDCFDVITDDVLPVSALEIIAKRRLIGKRYVIHFIQHPGALLRRQNKKPIHCRTVSALASNGSQPKFSQNTLGLEYLLKPTYYRAAGLDDSIRPGIEISRKRRNLVHFHSAYAYTVDQEFLAFVDLLDATIPKQK